MRELHDAWQGSGSGRSVPDHGDARQSSPPRPANHVRAFSALIVAVALLAAGPYAADGLAAAPLTTGFSKPLYQFGTAAEREAMFSRTVKSRARIARINMVWRSITSGTPANPADPADPACNFGPADAAVRGAAARGLDIMITIYGAPVFAEGPGRPSGRGSQARMRSGSSQPRSPAATREASAASRGFAISRAGTNRISRSTSTRSTRAGSPSRPGTTGAC